MTKPATRQDGPPAVVSPKKTKRGRGAKRLTIVVLVLAVILVGADFGLAAVAEHAVSQKAREQLNLTDDPAVTIHGFPFSTQAIDGNYGHISIEAKGIAVADKLQDAEVKAELSNVTAPLSDLTSGNTNAIKIGNLEGKIKIKATDIARIAPLTAVRNLRIEPASESFVRTGQGPVTDSATTDQANHPWAGIQISGEIQLSGQSLQVVCFALIELDGTKVRITPQRSRLGNGTDSIDVGPEVQRTVLPNFKATIDAGSLPFKVTPTSVKVESGSVTLTGTANDVTFAGITTGS